MPWWTQQNTQADPYQAMRGPQGDGSQADGTGELFKKLMQARGSKMDYLNEQEIDADRTAALADFDQSVAQHNALLNSAKYTQQNYANQINAYNSTALNTMDQYNAMVESQLGSYSGTVNDLLDGYNQAIDKREWYQNTPSRVDTARAIYMRNPQTSFGSWYRQRYPTDTPGIGLASNSLYDYMQYAPSQPAYPTMPADPNIPAYSAPLAPSAPTFNLPAAPSFNFEASPGSYAATLNKYGRMGETLFGGNAPNPTSGPPGVQKPFYQYW